MLINNAVGVNSCADSHTGFLHKICHAKATFVYQLYLIPVLWFENYEHLLCTTCFPAVHKQRCSLFFSVSCSQT